MSSPTPSKRPRIEEDCVSEDEKPLTSEFIRMFIEETRLKTDNLKAEVDELKQLVKEKDGKVDALKKLVNEKDAEVDQLKQLIKEKDQQFQKKISEINKELSDTTAEMKSIRMNLRDSKKDFIELKLTSKKLTNNWNRIVARQIILKLIKKRDIRKLKMSPKGEASALDFISYGNESAHPHLKVKKFIDSFRQTGDMNQLGLLGS